MKKLISFALALLLTVGCMPVMAFASDDGIKAEDLYITEGLTLHVNAMLEEAPPTTGTWTGEKGSLSLIGNWERTEDGKGIGYANKTSGFTGLSIPAEAIGMGSYTIETVITPLGNLDSETGARVTGQNSHDGVLRVGPFKAYGYSCIDTPTTSLALRYYYAASGSFAANGSSYLSWNSFLGYSTSDLLTYTLRHETDGVSSRYTVLHDMTAANVLEIPEESYVPFSSSDGFVQLFCYFPVNAYAVRVYDRVLSDAERAQNRFADLLLYHDIEPSLFWEYLSAEEQSELMLSASSLSFNEDKSALGRLISAYLYDETELASASFLAMAEGYGLDLLPFLTADRASVEAEMAFVPASGEDAEAVQELLALAVANKDPLTAVITFSHFDARSDERPEVNAVFTVNEGLLKLLRKKYTIEYGTLVGLAEVYKTHDALTLTEKGEAPENASVYYADKGEELTMTVYWSEEYQNKKDYRHAVAFRAFLTVIDATGSKSTVYVDAEEVYESYSNTKVLNQPSMYSLAKYLVAEYNKDYAKGYDYYYDAILRDVLMVNGYNIPTRDEELADADRLSALQKDLAEGLKEALMVESVRFSDQGYSEFSTDSIWVEYLADSVQGDKRIRPAYIYFPSRFDPADKSDEQLKKEGMLRVFCYIGMPTGDDIVPGLMCVHGGGGQAYINYVKEALNHGYAAIAIDCDGETRSDPTLPDGSGYVLDILGVAKDSLAESSRDVEEQWMYFVQRALIYANTVLRSFDRVDENAVGITGISWGGLTTAIAISHDSRYAFAAPVYLSGNMDESVGSWSGEYYRNGLWYNDALLHKVEIPVLIINSDSDYYASLNTNALTYFDLPNAGMCIIHAYSHSQQKGASLSEIYAFGNYITGYGTDYMPEVLETPDEKSGRAYDLTMVSKKDLSDYTATVWYLTEPISYLDNAPRIEWQSRELAVEDGVIHVEVPEEACVYYVSYTAYSKTEDKTATVYYEYDGIVYASTPLITIGSYGLYS